MIDSIIDINTAATKPWSRLFSTFDICQKVHPTTNWQNYKRTEQDQRCRWSVICSWTTKNLHNIVSKSLLSHYLTLLSILLLAVLLQAPLLAPSCSSPAPPYRWPHLCPSLQPLWLFPYNTMCLTMQISLQGTTDLLEPKWVDLDQEVKVPDKSQEAPANDQGNCQ